ncbi:MAG: hypothetical protein KQJ78_11840 [Deltaproteobacteria bacterium]|nr:hypothetical protein [Deltaproteobacteria bacterium]
MDPSHKISRVYGWSVFNLRRVAQEDDGVLWRMILRRWPDLLIICLLAVGSYWVGQTYFANVINRINNPLVFHQQQVNAAVISACGQGYQHCRNCPELEDFARLRVKTFSCAQLPAKPALYPPSVIQETCRNLFGLFAWAWRDGKMTWPALAPVFAGIFAVTQALIYLIFRLGMGRLLSLAGSAVFAVAHVTHLIYLRDYSKAPFILFVLFLCGVLLLKKINFRGKLVLGVLAGSALGYGYGFRTDVLICLPAFAAAVAFFTPEGVWRLWKQKLAVILVFLACFTAVGWPAISFYSHYSNLAHVTLLGLTERQTPALNVENPFYYWSVIHKDSYTSLQVATYAYLATGDQRPYPTHQYDLAYNAAGMKLLFDYLLHYPADALARAYAAILGIAKLPFLLLALFVVFSFCRIRYGLFFFLAVAFFIGYASIQFQERNFFHMEFAPLWLWGVALAQLAALGHHLFQKLWREKTSLAALGAAARQGFRTHYWKNALFVVLAVASVFVLLAGARWYQGWVLAGIYAQYEAPGNLIPVKYEKSDLPDGRLKLSPPPLDMFTRLAGNDELDHRVGYMALRFGPDPGLPATFDVRLDFGTSPDDYSEDLAVTAGPEHGVALFVPVYNRLVSRFPGEFRGVIFDRSLEPFFRGMSLVKDLHRTPPIRIVNLHQGWQNEDKFQTIKPRDGWTETWAMVCSAERRWEQLRRMGR